MKFELYKLKATEENIMRRFMGYGWLEENGLDVDPTTYELSYIGDTPFEGNVTDTLEQLFHTLNVQPPAGFRPRTMSHSDVVVLEGNAYYCDSYDFKPVPAWNK